MMTTFFTNPHTWAIVGTIFFFGSLAGYASNFLDAAAPDPTRAQNRRGIILGILAAATVPLLLQILSSDLLSDAAAEPHKYLVFGGYCVVTALFADRFLRGIGDNLLKKLSDLETKVDEARENADAALENSSDNSATVAEGEADMAEQEGEAAAEPPADGEEPAAAEGESENESFNLRGAKKPTAPKSRAAAPPRRSIAPAQAPRDRVAAALRDGKQKTKTAEAIAKMAAVSVSDATGWLADLEANGSAKRLKTADGKVFWKAV